MSVLDRAPSLPQLLEHAMRLSLAEVHTSMPARIESFDPAKQTAQVKPLLLMPVEAEGGAVLYEEIGVLSEVPVYFAGGGGFRITAPVRAGDTCWLVFAESSTDQWQVAGGLQMPGLVHRFHLNDAIAFVGAHDNTNPWTGVSADAMTVGNDAGPQILFTVADVQLGATDTQRAVDQAIKGTTYRTAEGAMLDGISASLDTIIANLSSGMVGFAAGAALNAVPVVGGALAVPGFGIFTAQVAGVVAALAVIKGALAAFKAGDASYLSTLVKVR